MFQVAENDELPHKICFRCSAKVEELYEFILKCIKTQESLQTTMGKKTPLVTKSRFRVQWETQLTKMNISNDDICNALIKKAMEGIKDVPRNPSPVIEENLQHPLVGKKVKNGIEPPVTSKNKELAALSKKSNITLQSDEYVETDDVKLKKVKLAIEKCDDKVPLTRTSRSKKTEALVDGLEELSMRVKQYPSRKSQSNLEPAPVDKFSNIKISDKQNHDYNRTTLVNNDKNKSHVADMAEKPKEPPQPPPPINIMDHVSIIKVNSVGTLFLCKLCNRNFLKKELVLTHGCAKNNVPKDKFLHSHAPPREVPRPSTVKYIKMDKDFKKPIMPPVVAENKPVERKPTIVDIKVTIPPQITIKPKPKIGPASKIKNLVQATEVPKEPPPPPAKPPAPPVQENKAVPSVQFPLIPSLNSRYKLVPGPNNTFTLVEDASSKIEDSIPQTVNRPGPKGKKRRRILVGEEVAPDLSRPVADKQPSSEVIDLVNMPSQAPVVQQPYPVGLFQTAHHSGSFAPTVPKPPTFTTPAMKKQSYTIVQTGNPSKLLISTKAQPVVEEPHRKKSKKSKEDPRENNTEQYNVPVEDNSQSKESGFFTFINVDPLMQPSYVLPTNNIIQESQISTSTPPASKPVGDTKEKDKYSCNMCDETFSREKKLLAHIQSHFNQMDEEDQLRREKCVIKKRPRKS